MATREQVKITDQTRVSELTVGELRQIIRDLLQDTVFQITQELPDPDAGLKLKPEVAGQLWSAMHEPSDSRPAEEVYRELGLLDE
jgi:hypothetical protein